MANINKTSKDRTTLIETIRRTLGGSMIDVELDPEDYHLAIDKAMEQYRQQSEHSTEESTLVLTLSEDKNEFILPEEVIEVRQIFRRTTGTPGSGGTELDPFNLAYTNMYLLQAGSNSTGGIATYYLYSVFQEELGKLFGLYINFTWETYSKKLTLMRRPIGNEDVILWVYNDKPEISLLNDRYSGPWLRDWATAEAKEMLGTGYAKYPSIPGPAGTTSLPGDALKAEAAEMKTQLRERLRNYETGDTPPWFVIG